MVVCLALQGSLAASWQPLLHASRQDQPPAGKGCRTERMLLAQPGQALLQGVQAQLIQGL